MCASDGALVSVPLAHEIQWPSLVTSITLRVSSDSFSVVNMGVLMGCLKAFFFNWHELREGYPLNLSI